MDEADVVVIGAGVVGLAIARALQLKGRECLVIEAESAIGTGISSRNSGVIHAGMYYAAGSLMAKACVEGRARLYDYVAERHIPHARCGKLIVATSAQEDATLAAIKAKGAQNGVEDLALLSRREAQGLEPALQCTAALFSPSTGIIDAHALMLALQGDAENAGAVTAFKSPVLGGRADNGRIILEIGGDMPSRLAAKSVINAGGLAATKIARAITGMPPELVPKSYLAKGSYFTLTGRAPFSRLIYPVPVPGGLGVHLTLDLGGQARFGPDVEWVEEIDYSVDPARAQSFYAAVRRYWPDLKEDALQPGYSGIRPKIVPKGAPAQDFVIQGPATHGIEGLIHLFGIESPGLTSALALAAWVTEML